MAPEHNDAPVKLNSVAVAVAAVEPAESPAGSKPAAAPAKPAVASTVAALPAAESSQSAAARERIDYGGTGGQFGGAGWGDTEGGVAQAAFALFVRSSRSRMVDAAAQKPQ